jgi:hypothetical protein
MSAKVRIYRETLGSFNQRQQASSKSILMETWLIAPSGVQKPAGDPSLDENRG